MGGGAVRETQLEEPALVDDLILERRGQQPAAGDRIFGS